MVKSSSPQDSENSNTAQKTPALSLPVRLRGADTEAGPEGEVERPLNSTAAYTDDGKSPMSRYFDTDSLTPMNQKPALFLAPDLSFFQPAPPSGFAPVTVPAGNSLAPPAGMSSTAISISSNVVGATSIEFNGAVLPASSDIGAPLTSVAEVDSMSTENASSIQSRSETSGQNASDSGVPVAVYVDLSVLRETKKGRNALLQPHCVSTSQASGHFGNQKGGNENRRRAQKYNP